MFGLPVTARVAAHQLAGVWLRYTELFDTYLMDLECACHGSVQIRTRLGQIGPSPDFVGASRKETRLPLKHQKHG